MTVGPQGEGVRDHSLLSNVATRAPADERASGPSVGIRASPSVRVGGSRSNAAAFTTSR
jgi:hypothetical protein